MERRLRITYEKTGSYWVMRLLETVEQRSESGGSEKQIEELPIRMTAGRSDVAPIADEHQTAESGGALEVARPDVATERATVANPLFGQALTHIEERRWNRAQQALQEVVRYDQTGEAKEYLEEVRTIRRCLRQLDRSPRYARLHLVLGRSYLGLELGDEALEELNKAVELEPDLAEAHFLLGIEHLIRGDEDRAKGYCQQAHRLKSTLPSWEDLLGRLKIGEAEDRLAS